ncbi:MAG: LytR C-terminal domain-containing protein [Candidatus Terrybacteria bacterium]|nr:LytR C-terminal domain-containing protein [Candidatus Terrybacteria bacterium]
MLSKFKFKKIIYPLISGIVAILIVIIFIYSVRFLAKAIDMVFTTDTESLESHLIRLDMENFYRVAEKLGISLSSQSLVVGSQLSLDKTAVKIKVINSTKTSGLAKELKTILEAGGFLINEIDTISPVLATTTIRIKESKKDYTSLVKETISQKYTEIEEGVLKEDNIYDIIIIIGSK